MDGDRTFPEWKKIKVRFYRASRWSGEIDIKGVGSGCLQRQLYIPEQGERRERVKII